MTCNARGLAERVKRKRIFHYCYEKNIDIVCLQETHFTKRKHTMIRNEWGGDIFYSDGETNARGVAILVRRGLTLEDMSMEKDSEGRMIAISFKIGNKTIYVCNVYAPNVDEPEFFVNIINKIHNKSHDYIVWTGD